MISVTPQNFMTEIVDASHHKIVIVFLHAAKTSSVLSMWNCLEKFTNQLNENFILSKVDVTESELQTLVSELFGHQVIPSILLFMNGRPVKVLSGFYDTQRINLFLEECLPNLEHLISSGSITKQVELIMGTSSIKPEVNARMLIFSPNIDDYLFGNEFFVTELMVNVGDFVEEGQSLITVEGDITSAEIPASTSGIVKEINVKVGDKVSSGSLFMILDTGVPLETTEIENKSNHVSSGKSFAFLDTGTRKNNYIVLNESVELLEERLNLYYQEEIQESISQYSDFLASINASSISEQTGLSPVAFAEIDALSYLPRFEFPECLRLGDLIFKNHKALSHTSIPWLHDFSEKKCLVISEFDGVASSIMLQNIALRVLGSIEPQLVHCHFIDSVGLGQSFSYLSHLSDAIKGTKILTESSEVERAMLEVKAAAVNLVQEKLTHQYDSLKAYNRAAGSKLAEPYRCIFIANFPCGFTQKAIETLMSIINTSYKSGISVFMSLEPVEFKSSRCLIDFPSRDMPVTLIKPKSVSGGIASKILNEHFKCEPDNRIAPFASELIRAINQKSMVMQNKIVDIDDIGVKQNQRGNSAIGITIPIGLVGKENPCFLSLGGEKSGHHVLIGGATGSGKTVLLHNIIINGALSYSPDELQFYLLDYKEGTEFKCYENLSHVHILSMESNRQFGLSVLQYLQEEIEKRGLLFKAASVANFHDYKLTTGHPMPRILVIIDEFQVLLKGLDRLSTQAAEILDDISRRGRSFGIHMVLASQTLSDVHLKSSTLSNIAVRIGLRMSESDSVKLFHRDNTLAATLKKPGDAYFNAAHGQSEGNIRFQAAWLNVTKIEEKLRDIRQCYGEETEHNLHRYIMDGQTYSTFRRDRLNSFIQHNMAANTHLYTDILLAEPGYISQQAVSIRLRRQFASNILAVGDSPVDVISLSQLILHQLLEHGSNDSHFYIIDLFAVDTPWYGQLDRMSRLYPQQVTSVRPNRLSELLDTLEQDIISNQLSDDEPSKVRKVIFLLNVQAARIFDASSSIGGNVATKKLEKILKEGADCGVHVFLHSGQYQGLEKMFANFRSVLKEFENCILLRGGGSEKLHPANCEPIKAEGMAYLLSPGTRYDADPCRLYCPKQVFEYFDSIKEVVHVD